MPKPQLKIDSPPEVKLAALKTALTKFGGSSAYIICRDANDKLLSVSMCAEGEEAEALERWIKQRERKEARDAERSKP
jgi:hypothetical protein